MLRVLWRCLLLGFLGLWAGTASAQKTVTAPQTSQSLEGLPPVAENILVLDMGNNGIIEIELLPQIAPLHVDQIKDLTRQGLYDGVAVHRAFDGLLAQTGDVRFGKRDNFQRNFVGQGGSDLPNLPPEFSPLSFEPGIVGMARGTAPDSANSQFFMMMGQYYGLNGQYTIFGRVISGLETLERLKTGTREANGMVTEPDFIETARIKADIPVVDPTTLPELDEPVTSE